MNIDLFEENNWVTTIFENFDNQSNNPFVLSKKKYNEYIKHLASLYAFNESVFNYNILFPMTSIESFETNVVKDMLEPSVEMTNYVNEMGQQLGLMQPFIIIQIRSGDIHLKDNDQKLCSSYFNTIKRKIEKIVSIHSKTILLISDNNALKYLLHECFPYIKLYFKDITHLGEGCKLEKMKIKNTLLDFYLMSRSNYIYSFTSYPHGSGFSYWCSKIYNIHYHCEFV